MKQILNDFKNNFKATARDIWVIGSGKSMDFVQPDFFQDKIVIGVNRVYIKFPYLNFNIVKHKEFIQASIDKGYATICPEYDCANNTLAKCDMAGDYIYFTHKARGEEIADENFQSNLKAIGNDDDIFVSRSAITSAIHIAAYMGAKNIIVCGHDCGSIDGESHLDGYRRLPQAMKPADYEIHYRKWLTKIEDESLALFKRLREVYNCNIYSLNPFINFRLEGHKYVSGK